MMALAPRIVRGPSQLRRLMQDLTTVFDPKKDPCDHMLTKSRDSPSRHPPLIACFFLFERTEPRTEKRKPNCHKTKRRERNQVKRIETTPNQTEPNRTKPNQIT